MKKRALAAVFFLVVASVAYAATSFTTNYNLAKPGDGDDNYGELLRDNFDTIDAQLKINADSNGILAGGTGATDEVLMSTGSSLDFAKITDANIDSSAAINSSKISDGSVSNTEFLRLGTAGTNGAGEFVTTDATQTLSDKTLVDADLGTPTAGIMSNVTGLPLTTGVTGVLPIANGGTNKALTLVPGGVPYADADSFEMGAAGTNGQRLKSSGTGAPFFAWHGSVHAVSDDDYEITDTDGFDTILVTTSTGDDTVELPPVSTNTGRMITAKKVDSGTGSLIIDGDGAETIDGMTTITLWGQYAHMTLVCDGTSWHMLNTYVEYASSSTGIWDAASAAGDTVFGPSGSAISGALTAVRNKVIQWGSAVKETDSFAIEFKDPTAGWIAQPNSLWPRLTGTSVDFSARLDHTASNQTTVEFARFVYPATFNSTAGAADYASGTYSAWRLKRIHSQGG